MKVLVVIVIFCTSFSSYSQDLIAMYKDKAYWGFMNIEGEKIITPKYTLCKNFRGGMAKVGKTYFINKKAEKFKPEVRILDAEQFSEGILAVKVVNRWGFMNTSGKLIVEAKYKTVTEFNGGYAIAATKKEVFIIDKNGNETKIISPKKIDGFKHFSEGLAPIEIDEKYGYVNEKGLLIIPPQYIAVGYFSMGMAWVRTLNGKIGYIDKQGNWLIEPTLFAAKEFDPVSKVARVKIEKGWTYINANGDFLPIEDKNINVFKNFEDGVALVKVGDLWGFINSEGGWQIEPTYKGGVTSFQNGYARVKQDGKWGVINKKGEWVLKPIYDNIKPFVKVE